jgi:predicted permease
MGTFLRDIKYGTRMLLKSPVFTVVAILALALGIGANSAIFSVVNAVLLRPLPFQNPQQLITVLSRDEGDNSVSSALSFLNIADLRDQTQTFSHVAAYSNTSSFLIGGDEPDRLRGAIVTADVFPLLGVNPAIGRTFTRDEDKQGGPNVIVLSHQLWQRRFGADLKIVGQEIKLSSGSFTVLGVMPERFQFPVQENKAEFWMPLMSSVEQATLESRGSVWLQVVARLKPGVSIQQAQAESNTIARRLSAQYPETNTEVGYALKSLHENLVGDVRPALFVMLGAVGFVLLISCANVANLLLARASGRQKEVAIRTALGASRMRVIRQLLTESMLLSLVGGTLGLLLALWGVDLLVAASPADIPRVSEIGLDVRVLIFTAAITLLTGAVFGLAPALQASKTDLTESLKEGGGRGSTEGLRRNRVRSALIVSEVALSLVLLVGAGLMIQSFWRLMNVSPGFDSDKLMTADVVMRRSKYGEGVQRAAAYQDALQRVAAVPGVQAAAAIYPLPLGGSFEAYTFSIEGRPPAAPGQTPAADYRLVSPDYFRTMGIQLLKGRFFTDSDHKDAPHVMIINESFARKHFANEEAVGKRITASDGDDTPPREIIGVVADVRHAGLDAEAGAEYYVSYLQTPPPSRLTIVARTSGDPASLAGTLRGAIRQSDQEMPVYNLRTMDQLLAQSVARRRFNMTLLGTFALVALVLASIGIYGVMSYSVTQRTHEIGIRLALGAQTSDVLKLIVRQGMLLVSIGVGLGLMIALLVTRVMDSLLYGVSATDPLTFGAITLLLAAVAFLACYLPARRATRVDPMIALRYE